MLISLDREQAEPLTWEESQSASEELLASSSLVDVGPIACVGRVEYVSPGFLLSADLSYQQSLECTRCLKPIRESVSSRLEILLMTPEEGRETATEPEIELAPDELNVVSLDENQVETAPLILEQVQLQLPMKPLCRDDCRGLCPRCGADRNETADCCPERGYDSLWSGLEGLKNRLQSPDS